MTHFCNQVPKFTQSACNTTAIFANDCVQKGSEFYNKAVEHGTHYYSQLPSLEQMRAGLESNLEGLSNFTSAKATQAHEFVSPYLPDLANAQTLNMIFAGFLVATFAMSTAILLKAATQEVSPEKSKAIVPVKAEKEEEIIEINTADFVKKPQPIIQQSPAWVVLIEIDSGTAAKVNDFIEDFNNFCISMMLL